MSATAVLNLSKAGFTDAQVSPLAEYFNSQMATKADIADLRGDIERVRSDLTRDIGELRSDLTRDIGELRSDLTRDIGELRSDLTRDIEQLRSGTDLKLARLEVKIADSKAETIKWVAGLLIAQGAAIVALIGFLPGMHP